MERLEFLKKNTIEWREYSAPKITEKNQAIVKPLVVSRCDLDLPIVRGETLFRPPFPLGHEFIGEIVSLSDDIAEQYSIGSKVAVSFQISCGTCPVCRSQHSQSCSSVPLSSNYGIGKSGNQFGGAISEAVLVPYAKQMLFPIQEKTNLLSIASISDNLAEAWKLSGRFLAENPNRSVLVLGGHASSIGLYTGLLSKFLKANSVTYADTNQKRLAHAEKLGIDVLELREYPRSLVNKYDLICDASGREEAWMCGLKSLQFGGTFTTASIFWSNKHPVPFLDLYNSGATIHIERVHSRETIPKILHLVEQDGFDPSGVVTKVANWKDAKDAFVEEETKLVLVQ